MAGTSAQWNNYNYLNAQKNIFTFENVHEMDNGQKMESMGGNTTEWSLFSYMARVNYDYMNRYLVTATHTPGRFKSLWPQPPLGYFPLCISGLAPDRRKMVQAQPYSF